MAIAVAGNTHNPESMVMLLHGYGANGQDLISLADDFAPLLPNTIFVSPDAPEKSEMSPFGFQWFSLTDWSPVSLDAGAKRAAPALQEIIETQLDLYHIKPERLALVGFSQGTMMALYMGVRRTPRIAGILGYSGALVCSDEWPRITLQKPPICLVHGLADNIVPAAAYYHARQTLEGNDFEVEGQALHGLMHGINQYGVDLGATFLQKVLG